MAGKTIQEIPADAQAGWATLLKSVAMRVLADRGDVHNARMLMTLPRLVLQLPSKQLQAQGISRSTQILTRISRVLGADFSDYELGATPVNATKMQAPQDRNGIDTKTARRVMQCVKANCVSLAVQTIE